jgi:hypothetical protein
MPCGNRQSCDRAQLENLMVERLFSHFPTRLLDAYATRAKLIPPVGPNVLCMHEKGTLMATSPTTEIDFIEELKLRRWARENYVPQPKRDRSWHPVIHDEMVSKDRDTPADVAATVAARA